MLPINSAYKYYLNINNKRVPLIYGGKGCFVADTLISTPKGNVLIQNIKKGDKVYSFDKNGNKNINVVTETFVHNEEQDVLIIDTWNNKQLIVTPNHWVFTPDGYFIEACMLSAGDCLVDISGKLLSIVNISSKKAYSTYNLTVAIDHTYIANNILVHNKGGNKGSASPGVESPNNLFSTDILFLTVGLGEGPIFRINPNGPQDIEMNDGSIDDLINIDTDGSENTEVFKTLSTTGTLGQDPLPVFGSEVFVPQTLTSPVTLKKGNIAGIPQQRIFLQNTSTGISIDRITFNFLIASLFQMNDKGDIFNMEVSFKVTVFDRTGTTIISSIEKTINGKTNTNYKISLDVSIPEVNKSTNGYKFTIEKTSDDSEESKISDIVQFIGWDEITSDDIAYTRTAIIGYAIKADSNFRGSVPTITSLIKGKLVKVPSNYNQPILENGDIDWRELEIVDDDTGVNPNSYQSTGYRLQSTGSTILYDDEPIIYKGYWDGTFVFAWTQNPVWILYDMLTNINTGLGIPEEHIDKYKFYKVAQYCDAVDPMTGKFIGVTGYADGTFRHKPLNAFTSVREKLIGLNEGIEVLNRRFICDLTISSQDQVFDLIQKVASIFRGIVFYNGGKLSINVDLPDELPVAAFSESNISDFTISGTRESEIITGVEVAYIDPSNHFRRELVRVDDEILLEEQNHIENVIEIEATGCTRRSQAIRLALYFLASSKYIRRKITFKTNIQAINVTVGDVISISNRVNGTAWGYAGKVVTSTTSNVTLEHFTSPAIDSSVFTANTNPLALRIINLNSDRVGLYLLENSYSLISSGNASIGADLVEVTISKEFNPQNKTYSNFTQFTANNQPLSEDLWSLGEIDVTNMYNSQAEKLFKVTNIERDEKELITIAASEYISNVYIDSDKLINYVPVRYTDIISPLVPPPAPLLSINSQPKRHSDGSISHDLNISITTDKTSYPIDIQTEIEYAHTEAIIDIEGII